MTPYEHRQHILATLVKEPTVSIPVEFANRNVFPDVSVSQWCESRNIKWIKDKIIDQSSIMNHREYEFYIFELICTEATNDDQL